MEYSEHLLVVVGRSILHVIEILILSTLERSTVVIVDIL